MDLDEERPRTSIRPPSRAPWVVLAVALAAAAGGLVWWLRRDTAPPPAPGAAATATPASPAAPASGPEVPAERMRALLDAVSADPGVRRLLGEPDLARRWALATDNVAEGIVPRRLLSAFAPQGPFAVVRRGGATYVDPASYRRFDAVGDAVASVDARALAAAWRALRPALDVAYRALGYPEGGIDRATARALARLETAPLRDGDVELVPGAGATWAYADPRLEQLPDVERQLLRMGPRNTRIVQEKAREVSRALELPPAR
jgi:hypothetical protein